MSTVHLDRASRARARRATTLMLTDEWREFESASSPGTIYRAIILVDGKTQCNCRGWITKRQGRPRQCKHTTALIGGRTTRTDGDFVYLVKEGR